MVLSRSVFQLPESASLSMSKQNLLLQLYNTIVIHPIRSPDLDSTINLLHRTVLVLVASSWWLGLSSVNTGCINSVGGSVLNSNHSVSVSWIVTVYDRSQRGCLVTLASFRSSTALSSRTLRPLGGTIEVSKRKSLEARSSGLTASLDKSSAQYTSNNHLQTCQERHRFCIHKSHIKAC